VVEVVEDEAERSVELTEDGLQVGAAGVPTSHPLGGDAGAGESVPDRLPDGP
jgi:hypothetical protein